MKHQTLLGTLTLLLGLLLTACQPEGIPVDEVIRNLDDHLRTRVTIRARFKSGARCRQGTDGEWRTYCKDCQYCRGPLVVDSPLAGKDGVDDWPIILGGVYKMKDIRCMGPLNKVECYPFTPGKTYIVRGRLEANHPARLLVDDFWEPKD